MNTECVCKTCKNHCECELHDVYEHQEDGCNNGKNPIQRCSIREGAEKQSN